MMGDYNSMELMIVAAARTLPNGSSVVVGTGAPCAAAMLAQRTHAPELVIVFEAGGIAPRLRSAPLSVGDSRTFYGAAQATSMNVVMDACSRGCIDYAFLGGAQIDSHGNLNSTCIGEWARPKVRFPGSGGANDLASLCRRTIVMTSHTRSRFVETPDFVTTPGYLSGKGAREAAGLPPGTGPYRVITDLAVIGYDEDLCRMRVLSIHQGHTREEVIENTGFEMLFAEQIGETSPPTKEELRILRDEVDPSGVIIGR
jgi:glutaconate CoA-transferase subunit B